MRMHQVVFKVEGSGFGRFQEAVRLRNGKTVVAKGQELGRRGHGMSQAGHGMRQATTMLFTMGSTVLASIGTWLGFLDIDLRRTIARLECRYRRLVI